MIYHNKRQVSFEYELNQLIRTDVITILVLFFFQKISVFYQQKPCSISRQSVYVKSKQSKTPSKIVISNKVNNWTVSMII